MRNKRKVFAIRAQVLYSMSTNIFFFKRTVFQFAMTRKLKTEAMSTFRAVTESDATRQHIRTVNISTDRKICQGTPGMTSP